MKRVLLTALAALFLASCVQAELEPIPGSITYGGQPRSKLQKAPVGSSLNHYFFGPMGERIEETYIIQPDRSLKLVARRRSNLFFPDFD